jgi:hypothetical protein
MIINSIFKKPVDRPIEGVIKADDEASLSLEIEEYVLTNEVEKRLESFLDAYNNYEGANGVWLSGFFGSGKSHLLKMLALLLENREIDGDSTLNRFLPKCGDNEILRGELKRAVAIPSKSILFNIDQKADVISKTQIDALLAVFVKVFDEMCGYYGKQGHIAQFERDLDSRNIYEQFQKVYETLAGCTWQKGREQALFESNNIAKAYAQVSGCDEASAIGILEKCRSQYHVSIEDFAEQVKVYIDRQSPNFRLNFFVDEVGQYVAGNVKLMTNLQTIAESLSTKCLGRSWIIVTAQEEMVTVVGEMSQQQGNDFTKIQARFANRMKLTSTDVAEVIQKRLLEKNDEGARLLSNIYDAEVNNFRTLFDFVDGSQTYRNYRDSDNFINSYPFIPYQFPLFQAVIQNLSMHNAFEGKHSSVGERSMLGVFQQVVIQIDKQDIGQLATFDLMFEGIRTALKANIQKTILLAEKQLDNTFAVRLLTALFLVKYVKEFKPTIRNLVVLMVDNFNSDLPQLHKKVEECLKLLEQQTYIQRNGELYEYLTDEEKDVEEEIKNTDIDNSEVAVELEKIIFDQVIKSKKIRYENGQDYPYSRKLDDRLHGREQELSIHVVSPFHENAGNETTLKMQSMGRDELLVLMPPDDLLIRDILMYKRTEKYLRQNYSITQRDAVKRILDEKGSQNQERYTDLQQHVKRIIGKAKLCVGGNDIEIGTEDAVSRITHGFHELIGRTYPNLRMLCDITYAENDITKHLKPSQQGVLGNDVTSMRESEQEMLAYIQSNDRSGIRTTLKKLLEKFERKPYGWYYASILCILAILCARGKVELRADGNVLEENELERALLNTHGHGNVVIVTQVEFTATQVRVLKEFFEDLFDVPPNASEARALGKDTGVAVKDLSSKLDSMLEQSSQYPFLEALAPVIEKLRELSEKSYSWYLTELIRQKTDLIEMKEDIINPVLKFWKGPQKVIFDNARKFVQDQEPNFDYIDGDEAAGVISALNDHECFKGNRIQQVKTHLDTLQSKVTVQVASEIEKARDAVAALKGRLCGMAEFATLNAERQEQLTEPFEELSTSIERQKLIAVIRDMLRRFEELDYQRLLSKMSSWVQPSPDPKPKSGTGTSTDRPETPIKYISSRAVLVLFDKAWLADESDVERYLDSMRKALLAEIHGGKRIQI